jgi:hypothetical protein
MHEVFKLQTHCSTFAVQVSSPVFHSGFFFYLLGVLPLPLLLLLLRLRPLCCLPGLFRSPVSVPASASPSSFLLLSPLT